MAYPKALISQARRAKVFVGFRSGVICAAILEAFSRLMAAPWAVVVAANAEAPKAAYTIEISNKAYIKVCTAIK